MSSGVITPSMGPSPLWKRKAPCFPTPAGLYCVKNSCTEYLKGTSNRAVKRARGPRAGIFPTQWICVLPLWNKTENIHL